MKRSEINAIIRTADAFIHERGFTLPPFAHWSPDDWRANRPEMQELVEHRLGWDVTDFGSGAFPTSGLCLFTLRAGHPARPQSKPYTEQLVVVEVDQITPLHVHEHKTQDLINRGGGTLAVQLYNATTDGGVDDQTPVQVSVDGVARTVAPGDVVELAPGESITLPPSLYHAFWGQGSTVLVGEISSVIDELTDTHFSQPTGRSLTVEEDEPPLYLLCTDYPRYYSA